MWHGPVESAFMMTQADAANAAVGLKVDLRVLRSCAACAGCIVV